MTKAIHIELNDLSGSCSMSHLEIIKSQIQGESSVATKKNCKSYRKGKTWTYATLLEFVEKGDHPKWFIGNV